MSCTSAMIDLVGSTPENWRGPSGSTGSLRDAIAGAISPAAVRAASCIASLPRSALSICGYVSNGISAVGLLSICGPTFACRSSVAKIGMSGPAARRTRSRTAPSPSSNDSVTMAPCRSSTMASGLLVLSDSSMAPTTSSNTRSVTRPPGIALVATTGINSMPSSLAAATAPPMTVFVPARPSSSSPRNNPFASNSSRSVGLSANVLVSWTIPANSTRIVESHLFVQSGLIG